MQAQSSALSGSGGWSLMVDHILGQSGPSGGTAAFLPGPPSFPLLLFPEWLACLSSLLLQGAGQCHERLNAAPPGGPGGYLSFQRCQTSLDASQTFLGVTG